MNNDEVKPKLELISLFSIPVVKTNIGREFTKDELQFFNTDIPMSRDSLMHHQSESFNIFDNGTRLYFKIEEKVRTRTPW